MLLQIGSKAAVNSFEHKFLSGVCVMMILRGHLARIALVRCFQIADKFDTVIKMIYVRMIRFYCTKSTVLQQYMFAYNLKVFCMAAYKLFYFFEISSYFTSVL